VINWHSPTAKVLFSVEHNERIIMYGELERILEENGHSLFEDTL
jgi:hypothetical protein